VNIDDVAGEDIGEMTLNAITGLLENKIAYYSKYKQTDNPGVYAIDPAVKLREDMIKWLYDATDPEVFPTQGPQLTDLELLSDDELAKVYAEIREMHERNDS